MSSGFVLERMSCSPPHQEPLYAVTSRIDVRFRPSAPIQRTPRRKRSVAGILKRTTSVRVVGFLAVQFSTICFGQSAYPPASLPASMTAGDFTYTVPMGWQLAVRPMLEYGLVFGQQ